MRYKMIFSYRGTDFYGYQVQNEKRTIQGEIEKILFKLLQENIRIYASGRTDRGVHALNQVAIFDVDKELDVERFRHSLNSLLANDIHIKSICKCDIDFHARFSAIGKKYIYEMAIAENEPLNNYGIFYSLKNYDFDIMEKVMELFVGEHDFKNFCTNKEEESYVETIFSFKLIKNQNRVTFSIIGSGFKRYMVRMIVGTVLACGLNKFTYDEVKNKLDSKIRDNVSFKVPPEGLYLSEVYYDKESLNND